VEAAHAITLARAMDGTVILTAPWTGRMRELSLELTTDTMATDARINGRPTKFLSRPGKPTRLIWASAPEGLVVSFKPAAPGRLDVGYAAYLEGWPEAAKPLPSMPPTVMGFDLAGSTVVTGRLRQTW